MEEDDFDDDRLEQLEGQRHQGGRGQLHRLSEMLPKLLRFSLGPHRAATLPVTSSSNLRVFVRVRPLQLGTGSDPQSASTVQLASQSELLLLQPAGTAASGATTRRGIKGSQGIESYTFTRVFGQDASQQGVYESTAAGLVTDFVEFRSQSTVVMAYGSSGSGKTFSIQGTNDQAGVLPRLVQSVFQELSARPTAGTPTCAVSYYEVYNDQVYDLLPSASGHGRVPLRIRETAGGQVSIAQLSQAVVGSATEALELHTRAAKGRQQAATGVNSSSSRSHSIFTITLTEAVATCQRVQPRTSRLHVVDLAGAERVARTLNSANRLKESNSINTSLMTLGKCLEALRVNSLATLPACQQAKNRMVLCDNNSQSHAQSNNNQQCLKPAMTAGSRVVPYRESKLTHLFKEVFLGAGSLTLLVCVSPANADVEETQHALRTAALAHKVRVQPAQQASTGPGGELLPLADISASQADAEVQQQNLVLQAQVEALQEQVQQLEEQLRSSRDHTCAVEASIRDEVVEEIQQILSAARQEYEQQLEEAAIALAASDQKVQDLQHQVATLLQQHQSNTCSATQDLASKGCKVQASFPPPAHLQTCSAVTCNLNCSHASAQTSPVQAPVHATRSTTPPAVAECNTGTSAHCPVAGTSSPTATLPAPPLVDTLQPSPLSNAGVQQTSLPWVTAGSDVQLPANPEVSLTCVFSVDQLELPGGDQLDTEIADQAHTAGASGFNRSKCPVKQLGAEPQLHNPTGVPDAMQKGGRKGTRLRTKNRQ